MSCQSGSLPDLRDLWADLVLLLIFLLSTAAGCALAHARVQSAAETYISLTTGVSVQGGV
jgi:hypothetical protein